jgi:hypothetical protein
MDTMMDRHLNYWRAEARTSFPKKPLYKECKPIFDALWKVIFKRKTFLLGWNGIALAMAYLSYSMLRFVYIWEKRMGLAPKIYGKIKENMRTSWEMEQKS